MFSSKKIIYFVVMSVLLICYINNIDYRVNMYGEKAQLPQTVVDFSDSAFTQINTESLISVVSTDDEEQSNTATAEYTDPSSDPSEAVIDVTDPIVTDPTDPTDPVEPITTTTTYDYSQPGGTTAQNPGTVSTTTTNTTAFTTTTKATTTTATTTTTTATTTTTKAMVDTGNMYFSAKEIKIYVGQTVSGSVNMPIGAQKKAYFGSKDTSVASVSASGDTTVEITGVNLGTTWIQATGANGDIAYCKVNVVTFESEVLELTNEQRRLNGLPDLAWGDSKVSSAAQTRLRESQSYFSHTRPDGRKFYTVAADLGFTYQHIGENLACGQVSPKQVVSDWMNSTKHRNNILSRNYTQLCVAYGIGNDGYTYWVQMFYTPR